MFTELRIKDETYKLRLNTRGSVALEKALGRSPLDILMKFDEGQMPTLTDIIIILHAMLQPMNHGMSIERVYDLYDAYVADGHHLFDLIPVIVEVFQESGYLAKPSEGNIEADVEKN